jgi:hypothetical protein
MSEFIRPDMAAYGRMCDAAQHWAHSALDHMVSTGAVSAVKDDDMPYTGCEGDDQSQPSGFWEPNHAEDIALLGEMWKRENFGPVAVLVTKEQLETLTIGSCVMFFSQALRTVEIFSVASFYNDQCDAENQDDGADQCDQCEGQFQSDRRRVRDILALIRASDMGEPEYYKGFDVDSVTY